MNQDATTGIGPISEWNILVEEIIEANYGRPMEYIGIYFCPVVSFYISVFLSFFFSSPNLSGRRLDVYHTWTHGVALVRI